MLNPFKILSVLLLGAFLLGSPAPACAASQSCDVDFMTQIAARAFMEAERETLMAGVVIRKPDSVLDYSCFDQFRPRAFESHKDNFNHPVLGGAGDGPSGNSPCTMMNHVHFLARCNNTGIDDPFWRFSELVSLDPRILPKQCGNGTGIFQDHINIAENRDRLTIDNVETQLATLEHESCAPPIPTGLNYVHTETTFYDTGAVKRRTHTPIVEKFCPTPGCHYQHPDKCVR